MYQSKIDPSLTWATPEDLDAWREANPNDSRGDWIIILPDPPTRLEGDE